MQHQHYWVCHSRLTCTLSRCNFCLSAVQQIVKFAVTPFPQPKHAPGGNEGTKRSASIGFSTLLKASPVPPCSLRFAHCKRFCEMFFIYLPLGKISYAAPRQLAKKKNNKKKTKKWENPQRNELTNEYCIGLQKHAAGVHFFAQ